MIQRRHFALTWPAAAALAQLPAAALAQTGKKTLTLGMALEPPGLDPTAGAASAIAEVVLYNVFETLTKIQPDGSVAPLLAERWSTSADGRTLTFHLRPGVKFSNGQPCDAQAVKFSFERAASDKSTNKDKRFFSNLASVQTPDAHTVVLTQRQPDPDALFYLGQATAIIVEPQSAATNATRPVGTGPYVLDRWAKGSSITLKASPHWRGQAAALPVQRAVFRFISDPAAQAAAVLSGDVELFARIAPRSAARLRDSGRVQTLVSDSRAKTLVALNHRHPALADVRVRRAIAAAIDRQALITGAGDGLGVPIGSHYVPSAPGYVDTTGINPYNPDKARALLKEAGVNSLNLRLVLPPPPYARQGGEIVAAQLAQVGITARVQYVEWAQWLAQVYGGAHAFDLTIISHVEPFDLGNFSKPDYYWGYRNPRFDALYERIRNTPDVSARHELLAQAQRLLAEDAALAWLYQPQWLTAAHPRLQGMWPNMPIFVNDLSALHWKA